MYQGVFLNLPRSEKRRAALLQHLAEVGAAERYQHCEAIDGRAAAAQHPTRLDPGNLGLWLSHEKVLQQFGAAPTSHLHIIEDDAILPRNAVPMFDDLLRQLTRSVPDWDLLFTDVFIAPKTEFFLLLADKVRHYARTKAHVLMDLGKIPFSCTSSLFINQASLGKYSRLIAGKWAAGWPIDMHLRDLVLHGHLKAVLTVPFMTTVSPASTVSDINPNVNRSQQMCLLYRRAFYQEVDIPTLLGEMRNLTSGASTYPLLDVYLEAEKFSLSDEFVPF